MTITIRTVGNPALYRSLQDGFASETRHRTISGAVRRLDRLRTQTARWEQTAGQWGRVEIEIDGRALDGGDVDHIEMAIADAARDPWQSGDAGEQALRLMIGA